MSQANVLILPGYGDSEPEHWQTLWERAHDYTRVVQDDWLEPTCDAWIETLERAVHAASEPAVLVAHSLACALVAHLAVRPSATRVAGALLVAPADVESEGYTPDEVRSFTPLPLARLVEIGRAGHINADAEFGPWPEGERLLESLLGERGRA